MKTRKIVCISIVLLLLVSTMVFAGLADNIRVELITSNQIVLSNYNDVPVTVSVTIEYTDGNITRFHHTDFSLGRKGFTSDTRGWASPSGTWIIGHTIKSVR